MNFGSLAHGLSLLGVVACRVGRTGPPASPAPRSKRLGLLLPALGLGGAAWPACALTGVARTGCAVMMRAAGGQEAARFSVRAPPLSGECTGAEEVVSASGLW
jgi:hypothetical protein